MSDHASVNKCFNKKFSEVRKAELPDIVEETEMLFCNAQFLLGLPSECEKRLKRPEYDLANG